MKAGVGPDAPKGLESNHLKTVGDDGWFVYFLSHRLWPAYDDILDACCAAWNALLDEAGRIRSLCSLDWATQVRT